MIRPRVRFAVLGFVLGLGSPLGWLLLRCFSHPPVDSWVWCLHELNDHRALYLYLTIGTVTSFSVFGCCVGRLMEQVMEHRRLLEVKTEDYKRIVSFVAHELRTPLTLVKGRLDLALGGAYGPLGEALTGDLKKAERGCREINDMASHYLDLARIEQGELKVSFVRLDVFKDVLGPVAEELKSLLESQKMNLDLDGFASGGPRWIKGDPRWLKVVFRNLLGNAVRYGYPETALRLKVSETPSHWRLEVFNQGYGIPENYLRRIFQKFGKVPRDGKMRDVGTGLGLYIVKEIVEEHHGRVWCESKQDEWANFIIELPKSRET